MEKQINDFGSFIRGARKNIYSCSSNGRNSQRTGSAMKNDLWKKYDGHAEIESGIPLCVAFWHNEMRKAAPSGPVNGTADDIDIYTALIKKLMNAVNEVKTEKDLSDFYHSFFFDSSDPILTRIDYRLVKVNDKYEPYITNKLVKITQISASILDSKARKTGYRAPKGKKDYMIRKYSMRIIMIDDDTVKVTKTAGLKNEYMITEKKNDSMSFYFIKDCEDADKLKKDTYCVVNFNGGTVYAYGISASEAEEFIEKRCSENKTDEKTEPVKNSGKVNFKINYLASYERKGPDYLHGKDANTDDYLKYFNFKGGQFGNWVSDSERQKNLNMAFYAFCDLADVLGLKLADVSFGGKLSIAFGARGKGGVNAAMAHYEPFYDIINLTKMAGAGCLCHEWGHALDYHIGMNCNGSMKHSASDLSKFVGKGDQIVNKIVKAMRYIDGRLTDFYTGSRYFDRKFSKSGHGYWSSEKEMFARAFDCYVKDKLSEKGIHNDYLTSNSESFYTTNSNGNIVRAFPIGEERSRLNALFDELIEEQIKNGIFSDAVNKS